MNFIMYVAVIYLSVCDCNSTNLKNRRLLNSWQKTDPPEASHNFHNANVYLGYSNNPFGASKHLKDRSSLNRPISIGSLLPQSQIDETPPYNQIKFESIENSVDSGQVDDEIGGTQEARSKRGVIHLYNMVSCATGCNPLIYKGYGCYCGFLGSGYAVDGIDRCCKYHDWCYDTADCPMFLEYFVPYLWKCYRNKPYCAIDHGIWGGLGSCAQRLCECDRILSECLSRYPCPSSRAVCKSSRWRYFQNTLMIFK